MPKYFPLSVFQVLHQNAWVALTQDRKDNRKERQDIAKKAKSILYQSDIEVRYKIVGTLLR